MEVLAACVCGFGHSCVLEGKVTRMEYGRNSCTFAQPYPRGVANGSSKPVKWNGWGYEGTSFAVNGEGQVYLTGNEYELSGKVFPNFRPWLEENVEGMDIDEVNPPQQSIREKLPAPVINDGTVAHVVETLNWN